MKGLRNTGLVGFLLITACTPTTYKREVATDAAGVVPVAWASLANSDQIQAGWIAKFEDPVLTSLVLEAQKHNRELQGLAANIGQAKALARQAGAALLPTAMLETSSGRQSEEGIVGNANQANATLSWELDLWGRLRSQRNAAQASAEAVLADYRFGQYALAGSVAQAYFAAIDAQIQSAIVRQSESNLKRIFDLVELQYREGVASKQDLAIGRSDLASVRSQLAVAEGASRDALRALELLLGRYPGADLKIRTSLPTAPKMPSAGLPSDLLERRPDVIAAERRVAAAFHSVHMAKAARLPRISLTSSIGGIGSGLRSLLDPDNRSWSLGAGLLAPIFQGGALKAQVEQANAEQNATIAAYGQAALNAFSDVETALDAWGVLRQQKRQLEEAFNSAKEAYRIAKFRFDEGDMDLLDLLSVQQRVFERRMELTNARRSLLDQRINLYLALGGSWD